MKKSIHMRIFLIKFDLNEKNSSTALTNFM